VATPKNHWMTHSGTHLQQPRRKMSTNLLHIQSAFRQWLMASQMVDIASVWYL